ncbi:hypothetical protein CLAFUW4_14300 [Fulvia fulva]|uniref:Uncharacterized protein n=1 Tax=Passalora fulva TaxID=5499 RepID=A0A9Q8PLL8_PASFU|nr:uncharacterized protein CLAFUR5_14133 [Fulvia fulva]KAK4609170.1 hypothetical protein CLAFUR4_14300 [Fulvia fulva]KAK4609686.1 hypothetical protein CLAFUR0_14304 [Fulvia fulva]UJO24869.1 hypothetical protein CLAFUR5_14133 [Fulvia fulva]WPV22822.1 hypothetical protein CLAFUW4_14300 [Fulvia fulva]WPV37816.1 hypothetical protein CLAFUW7_14308 [Fulvia fulva]
MAPKSKLLSHDEKPKRKPHIPRKPLTTQGKILKAQAIKEKKAKNQPREAPPGSEMADAPTKKSSSKARSFAPPDEADLMVEALKQQNLAKARGQKKQEGWNIRKRPLTTQQKIAAAMAIKRAKGGKDNAAPAGRQGKVPGLMSILRSQDREFLPVTTEGREAIGGGGEGMMSWGDIKSAEDKRQEKKEEERLASVLFQPTLRARKWRDANGLREFAVVEKVKDAEQAGDTQRSGTSKEGEEAVSKAKPTAGWFTGLPDEVRNRIWKLVVVDDKSCIWPTSPTGREQPDLAMSCKQIRQEVLPIYYGLNTFGISLQKEPIAVEPTKLFQKKSLTGLAAVHKWASTIGNEDTTWLSMIQSWAFEYQDPSIQWRHGAVYEDDDSFVISMKIRTIRQERPEGDEDVEEAEAGEEVPPPLLTADAGVHVEASCFMPDWPECGKCRVPSAPIELRAAVMWMVGAGITANTLYKFANELRSVLPTLSRARCIRIEGGSRL